MKPMDVRTRLVYLQPSLYSDEAIAVGVIYEAQGRTNIHQIGSVQHIAVLNQLYDEEFTEQIIFSLQLLHEHVRSASFDIASSQSPIELLRLGAPSNAVCDNPDAHVRDLLRLSSSIFSKYRIMRSDNKTIDQETIERQLKDCIVRINPLVGKALVQTRKVEITKTRHIEIPIFGQRIMGASVSLSTSKPGGATSSGEALIARLNWARDALLSRENAIRSPNVYVFAPEKADSRQKSIIEDSVGELELIAEASEVHVRSANDLDSLARRVYEDEALQ